MEEHDHDSTWLHIGAGSFHRAHQAWYLQHLPDMGPNGWILALGNVRDDVTPTLIALAKQQKRYILETVTPQGERNYELIHAIRELIPWDPDLASLIAAGSVSGTKVVSFTVTEAGYYLTPAHTLDRDNPDIKADLDGGLTTIYGAVGAILRERMRDNAGPLTLLSCDNVRNNGKRFRDGLLEFLDARGETSLRQWTEKNTSSPCCMVDRITPRPTPDIAPRVLAETGFDDKVPVMAESFIQWVVEDDFIAGRPPLEQAGVEMVADVLPYEEAKIRILNVSHALAAWLGTLAGLEFIHEDMANANIADMLRSYVTEDVLPCLTPSPLDLERYRDSVLARFGNPFIKDANARVAADGYAKIPAMVAPTLRECYARGHTPAATAAVAAAFYLFLKRRNENALPYEYRDGAMNAEAVRAMFAAPDPLKAYANDATLFGELAGREDFAALLRTAVDRVAKTIG